MERNWFVQPETLVVVDEWGDEGPVGFHANFGVFGPYTKTEAEDIAATLQQKCIVHRERCWFRYVVVLQVVPASADDIWKTLAEPDVEACGDADAVADSSEPEPAELFARTVLTKVNRWSRRRRRTRTRLLAADLS